MMIWLIFIYIYLCITIIIIYIERLEQQKIGNNNDLMLKKCEKKEVKGTFFIQYTIKNLI